jgi:hypothetical protein
MDEQTGQLIKQRGSPPDANNQNSKLALVAADLLSRWANLERKAREQPKIPSKVEDNSSDEKHVLEASPDESRLPPKLSHGTELQPIDEEDFGKSVLNWLEALKNANSTLDFVEYPITDVENWKQRIQVNYYMCKKVFDFKSVENWNNNARKPLEDILMEGKRLANTGRMELQVHEALDRLDAVMNLATKV